MLAISSYPAEGIKYVCRFVYSALRSVDYADKPAKKTGHALAKPMASCLIMGDFTGSVNIVAARVTESF